MTVQILHRGPRQCDFFLSPLQGTCFLFLAAMSVSNGVSSGHFDNGKVLAVEEDARGEHTTKWKRTLDKLHPMPTNSKFSVSGSWRVYMLGACMHLRYQLLANKSCVG